MSFYVKPVRMMLLLIACISCGGSEMSSPTSPSVPAPSPVAVPSEPPQPAPNVARNTSDRPDDFPGPQVKVLYVLPSDAMDRQRDQMGELATSVESWTRWVEQATGGQRVRLDTYQGALDIAFYRLPRTDKEITAFGITSVNEIQAGIRGGGFSDSNKIYAVYYDGNNSEHCGQSLTSGGQAIAAAFLVATPPALVPCPQQIIPNNPVPGLTRSVSSPGYWEFVMAHEVFHMLGAVPSCAPHYSSSHVNDSPTDLMGVFTRPGVAPSDPSVRWNPSVIDVNRDDYYKHGRAACLDVAQSPFLTR